VAINASRVPSGEIDAPLIRPVTPLRDPKSPFSGGAIANRTGDASGGGDLRVVKYTRPPASIIARTAHAVRSRSRLRDAPTVITRDGIGGSVKSSRASAIA